MSLEPSTVDGCDNFVPRGINLAQSAYFMLSICDLIQPNFNNIRKKNTNNGEFHLFISSELFTNDDGLFFLRILRKKKNYKMHTFIIFFFNLLKHFGQI